VVVDAAVAVLCDDGPCLATVWFKTIFNVLLALQQAQCGPGALYTTFI